MGRIPEFTRTVLPQRAQFGLIDVERTRGQSAALQHRQNAENIRVTQSAISDLERTVNQFKFQEAQAKNTTWVNENVLNYKREMAELEDRMRQEYSGKPDGFRKVFDKELDKLSQGYFKQAPSSAAQIALKGNIDRFKVSAYENNINWERSRKAEMYAESLERSADNLGVLALRAGQAGETPETTVNGLLDDANAGAVAGSTVVSGPEKISRIRESMRYEVISNYIEGLAEVDPQRAKDLIKSGQYDDDLNADQLQRLDGVADAEIEKKKAEIRAEITDDIHDIEEAGKLGLDIPDNRILETITKAEGAGMEKQANALRDYMEIKQDVQEFAKMPFDEQKQALETLKVKIEGGETSEVDKYSALQQVLETKRDAVETDPFAYYSRHNVIDTPEPLDFQDQQSMAAEINRRRTSAQRIKDLDGIDVPLLMPTEIDALTKLAKQNGGAGFASFFTGLNKMFSEQELADIGRMTMPKSDIVGVALAQGNPVIAERIMIGAEAKGETPIADVRAGVNELIGGVLDDPIYLEQTHSAIYSYYKYLEVQNGDTSGIYDEKFAKQAIQDIMGPIVDIDIHSFGFGGSSKILSFKRGDRWVSEPDLQDEIKTVLNSDDNVIENAGDLPIGSLGIVYTAKDIRRSGRLISAGEGKYKVKDPTGAILKMPDGSDFIINLMDR